MEACIISGTWHFLLSYRFFNHVYSVSISQNKRKASAGIVISYTLAMLMYLFITVICFVYFGPDGIMDYNEPTINVLKAIEFKFIARIEVLFIAFYLLIFSLSWIPTMYMSVFAQLGWSESRTTAITCGRFGYSLLWARFSSCLLFSERTDEYFAWSDRFCCRVHGSCLFTPICMDT